MSRLRSVGRTQLGTEWIHYSNPSEIGREIILVTHLTFCFLSNVKDRIEAQ